MSFLSPFSPPSSGENKYSALGEAVLGACPVARGSSPSFDNTRTIRRDGTSSATPIAAGIAAFLLDYCQQSIHIDRKDRYEVIRKLFDEMSGATEGQNYRNLAPSYMFGAGRQPNEFVKEVLARRPGINGYLSA